MVTSALSQSTRTNTGARDVGQRAGTSAGRMPGQGVLQGWSGRRGPGSWWRLPFRVPLQHSNLEAQFTVAEEKLQLSLALQR